jgi:hypothetical protein
VGKAAGALGDRIAAKEATALFAGQEPVSIGARLAQGLKATGTRAAIPSALEGVGSARR